MQEAIRSLPYPLLVTLLAIIILSGIWYFGKSLATNHGSDVRVVWYLFFLTAILTAAAATIGTAAGAIDAKGNFHGSLGVALEFILKSMLDLPKDLEIFLGIVILVLVPQGGSFLFSGVISGCARAPVFVGQSFSFLVWSTAKSFISAAGILFSMAGYGWKNNWEGWSARGATAMGSMSLMLLLLVFYILSIYREITNRLNDTTPKTGGRNSNKLMAWMSRRIKDSS
jgi:hypothetical protein